MTIRERFGPIMLALLIGTAAVRGGEPQQARATTRANPAAQIDTPLEAAVERKIVPGVVAMAADRRGILYQGAFGMADVEHARPMTAGVIFRIASMTKPVTSVAAMQLVEQGRIALDDPVGKYLPELASVPVFESFDAGTGQYTLRPAAKPMTIRHLMTHTSGLGYPFTSTVLRDFKPRDGERYPAGPLLFEPGAQWLYGTSTDVLGQLVEKVSGTTLDEYFRGHILRPLGMSDTFFNVPDDKQPRLPAVSRRQADGSLVQQPAQAPRPTVRFSGGGGLSSTAGDYVRFLRMILNGGELDGVRILSADSVNAMCRNQIGAIRVRAVKTAVPEISNDFTFIADGRDQWGLGFLITADHVPGKRSAGSLSWGGVDNTYFWIDRTRGVAGVIMMQMLPFADAQALEVYDAFERGVYRLLEASTKKE